MNQPNQPLDLFRTIVGSQIWKMDTPQSDIDYYSVYVRESREFLLYGEPASAHFSQIKDAEGKEIEDQRFEIGKFLRELRKGNVNFIWAVMSPLIISEFRNSLKHLREITVLNYSQMTFNSIRGMALSDIHKYLEKADRESLIYRKKLNTAARTLQFGINLLLYEKAVFEPVFIKTREELDNLMIRLLEAKEHSTLPLIPPKPELFDDYLFKWRMFKLKELFPSESQGE